MRLAVTELLASTFLVPNLGALRAQHRGLLLELVTGNQLVDLARREADLALRVGPLPKQPNLVVRPLGLASFALYGSRAYLARKGRPRRVTRAGLAGHEVILYIGALATVPMARLFAEHAVDAEVVLRSDSVAAVYEAVKANLGLAVLPCGLAESRGLDRLGGKVLGSNPIWTVVHEDLLHNGRVRVVMQFLMELMKRERRALAGAAAR